MGAPGIDEMRWHLPVRPDDTIRVEGEVVAVRASKSRPDRGTVTIACSVINQHGEQVMSFRIPHLLRRRPAAEAAGN